MTQEALKMALEVNESMKDVLKQVNELIAENKALKESLAQEQEPVALPCCGYTDANAIKWNPLNGVVQCHNCGQNYTTSQRTEPVGVMVSMDVSKGDEPEYRIFGRIYEVMKDGEDEVTYLAIEDSRNFDTSPQRTWVGLAKEDRLCAKYMQDAPEGIEAVIDYIESKLKELNT